MRQLGENPYESTSVTAQLLGLPPTQRLVAGIVCVVAGAVLTVLLWGRGVIAGITLFLLAIGFFLSWSGWSGIAKEKKRRALVDAVRANKEDLLSGMIAAKTAGKNPIRFLNEQGVQEPELRTMLIEEMNKRLKSG